ncbi:MAG: TIGR03936 family radical SAM-associated protein, partial [Desulfosarcina sp.]
PSKPIVPFGKPVHDRLRMEIARGCTRGCRFCQAGMIYRPVRERRPQNVLASVNQAMKATGYEDVSLLSLSTGDYSCIAPLMKHIMEFGEKERLAVSLPSLRAGSLTPEMMALIQKVRKTGFTIAPEAGSQRLRDVINKNISEADIFETVKHAFALGWRLVKLYFMIGLPTETRADVEAIADLVQRLQSVVKQTGKPNRLNVSVATFVPKPHTPFQWERQINLEAALQKINWLKAHLKLPGVQFKWQDPRMSVIEGVWARGDRKLGAALIKAWQSGCRFDGWTDYFDYERWTRVFKSSGIDPQAYTGGKPDTFQSLPWDHIDIGVSRSFLRKERARAIAAKITDDCRTGECRGCGVCDFDRLKPLVRHDLPNTPVPETRKVKKKPSTGIHKYSIRFKKMGRMRFLGHLEMVKVFIRSLRRSGMPLQYSNGFHPMPKVSFGDTLPMGMQSENETMVLVLTEAIDSEKMIARLNPQLPNGLEICSVSPYDGDNTTNRSPYQTYHVQLREGLFNQTDLDWFFEQKSLTIGTKNKKGKPVVVDLKAAIGDIRLLDNRHVRMSLGRHNNRMVRPAMVLKTVFNLTEQQILTAIITKKKADHV